MCTMSEPKPVYSKQLELSIASSVIVQDGFGVLSVKHYTIS